MRLLLLLISLTARVSFGKQPGLVTPAVNVSELNLS